MDHVGNNPELIKKLYALAELDDDPGLSLNFVLARALLRLVPTELTALPKSDLPKPPFVINDLSDKTEVRESFTGSQGV